jgi:hypothetical protein
MIDTWWRTPAGAPLTIDVEQVVPRFVADPSAPVFAARHVRGWAFGQRRPHDTHPLPEWARRIETVDQLAAAYRVSRSRILELNPSLQSHEDALGPDTRVPDPEFTPLLAARLSAAVLQDASLAPVDRVKLIQSLVPAAAANPTALDTVLARLLIAAGPLDASMIAKLADAVRAAAPADRQPPDAALAARGYPT